MSTVLDQPSAVSSLDEAQQKQEEENRARAAEQERVERERLNKLRQSKQIVLQRLREDAYDAGANAIIGLDLDYTMFGDSIVGVIVSGTAVTIVPNRPPQPVV